MLAPLFHFGTLVFACHVFPSMLVEAALCFEHAEPSSCVLCTSHLQSAQHLLHIIDHAFPLVFQICMVMICMLAVANTIAFCV